jgi:hypothetical protein
MTCRTDPQLSRRRQCFLPRKAGREGGFQVTSTLLLR